MNEGLRWLLVLIVVSGVLALTPYPDHYSSAADTKVLTDAVEGSGIGQQASPENVLVEALIGEIRKLNPLLATYNPVDRDITSLIFEGLTTTNQYGEIIPDLARMWAVTPDGLEYIVLLRNDVLWQDGQPFTAVDVVFTFNLLSDPLFPGAAELHEFWRTIEVDMLDRYAVRFRLTQPLASFLDQLRIGIVPAHVLVNTPVDQLAKHPFNLSPIGTGPYQIETLTASSGVINGIQLRVAPVYRQRPEGEEGYALDRIVFRTYPNAELALNAYRLGEVNSVSRIPTSLQHAARQLPDLSLYTTVQPVVGVLIYNWDRVEAANNPRARRALAYAVDRESLVRQHLAGQAIPADSPLVPNSWAYAPDMPWPAHNLAEAQALLATANLGVAEESPEDASESADEPATGEEPTQSEGDSGSEGEGDQETEAETTEDEMPEEFQPPTSPFEFAILAPNDPALVALANDIAAGWGELGFTVTVEVADMTTLHTRLETGNFDAALIELSFAPNADPDPYVFWHQGQVGTGQNFGAMNDLRISEALEQARRETLGISRVALYREFQKLFAERAPALVLYYPLYIYGVDSRLEGVQLGYLGSASDRFRTIRDWTFADTG